MTMLLKVLTHPLTKRIALAMVIAVVTTLQKEIRKQR